MLFGMIMAAPFVSVCKASCRSCLDGMGGTGGLVAGDGCAGAGFDGHCELGAFACGGGGFDGGG